MTEADPSGALPAAPKRERRASARRGAGTGLLDRQAGVGRAGHDHRTRRDRIGERAELSAGLMVSRATGSGQQDGTRRDGTRPDGTQRDGKGEVRRIGHQHHAGTSPRRVRGRLRRAALILALAVCAPLGAAAAQKFNADEWITECDGAPGRGAADCSITAPFWQAGYEGKGSFALVVMLQTGNIGIVGQPFPVKAVLRIDKNPPIECRQARYCVFPTAQSPAIVKQLEIGSLILIDVFTAKAEFSFSLTPKGYQAGIAQIRAWGYRLPTD
jgi:hypothetical protein